MKASDEYLRRNLLHCSAVGCEAGLEASIAHLSAIKGTPKWLLKSLRGCLERAQKVAVEMVAHRDEVSPYKKEESK